MTVEPSADTLGEVVGVDAFAVSPFFWRRGPSSVPLVEVQETSLVWIERVVPAVIPVLGGARDSVWRRGWNLLLSLSVAYWGSSGNEHTHFR